MKKSGAQGSPGLEPFKVSSSILSQKKGVGVEYLKVSDTGARPYFFLILKIIPENRRRLGFPIFPMGFYFEDPPPKYRLRRSRP